MSTCPHGAVDGQHMELGCLDEQWVVQFIFFLCHYATAGEERRQWRCKEKSAGKSHGFRRSSFIRFIGFHCSYP